MKNPQFSPEQRINYLSSYPPIIQFIGVILGVCFDFFFPTKAPATHWGQIGGIFLILIATIVIFWSQKASAAFRTREKRGDPRHFLGGPYKWSSNPTSLALFLLIIGFGFLINSLMIILMSAIGYWISFIVYEEKKQKIMTEKYKNEYTDYQKKIKSL